MKKVARLPVQKFRTRKIPSGRMGERTVRFELEQPDSTLLDSLSQNSMGIVPADYDPEKPVGTGPFTLGDFEPGQLTVLKRNADYWTEPPYVDEVHLLNFNDPDALVNALLSTQVDVVGQLPLALVDVVNTGVCGRAGGRGGSAGARRAGGSSGRRWPG